MMTEAKEAREMATSAGKDHRAETITDRMRRLQAEMGVTVPKLRGPRSGRPRSGAPRLCRKTDTKTDS